LQARLLRFPKSHSPVGAAAATVAVGTVAVAVTGAGAIGMAVVGAGAALAWDLGPAYCSEQRRITAATMATVPIMTTPITTNRTTMDIMAVDLTWVTGILITADPITVVTTATIGTLDITHGTDMHDITSFTIVIEGLDGCKS